MIVEFAGAPGAGKTTVATELAAQLEAQGIAINQPTANLAHERSAKHRLYNKTKHAINGVVTAPGLTLQSAKLLVEIRQRQKSMYIKSLYNLLFLKSLYQSAKADEITVLDQGLLQVFWSIAYFSKKELTLDKIPIEFLRNRDQKYKFVLIEASSDSTRERLAQRRADNNHPSELEQQNSYAESVSNSSYGLLKKVARNMAKSEDNISVSVFKNEEPADIDRIVASLVETVME